MVNGIVPFNGEWNWVDWKIICPVNESKVTISYMDENDGTKSYLHIINHNWDSINHQMLPQYNIPVSIPVTNSCENLMLVSPDFADTVSISFVYEDSTVSLTMPELEYYNVVILDFTPTAVENNPGMSVPRSCRLLQNHPNPFNPQTTISYELPGNANVMLKIYDILGKEVRTLVNENKSAGEHSVVWNGKDNSGQQLSSGVYFYSLKSDNLSACGHAQADNRSQIKKLLLLK